jgi:hypothetical protein
VEEQNPTPVEGGASTLDRLERYLAAQDEPDQTQAAQPEQSDNEPAEGAAENTVEPDGDGEEQATEPQLSTSDLAKLLGLEEGALDLDEDGSVKLKTKVDGVEGAAKLQDLLKSYQLQEHVDRKAREAAEKEKAIQARQQEVEQQVAKRLEYAENLVNVAAQDLLREFQSIDWNHLEATDAGQAALLRQKFQERQAQLRGVMHNIEQNKAHSQQEALQKQQELLHREAARLSELIPEWKDQAVAQKERQEIRDWAVKAGFDPKELSDGFVFAHHVAVMRKAMQFDKLQQSRPAIENKVRTAPKLVKPGQAPQNTQAQQLRNLKLSVQKSGGKSDRVVEYLMATGRA